MSLSDDVKTALEADATLMALLTGGIHNDVEEISRQNTPGAFDATTKEILPCALLKLGVENRLGPYIHSMQSPMVIYLYERQGYVTIEQAMSRIYGLLHDKKIGMRVWRVQYESSVPQARDDALSCALGSLRFIAIRSREGDAL